MREESCISIWHREHFNDVSNCLSTVNKSLSINTILFNLMNHDTHIEIVCWYTHWNCVYQIVSAWRRFQICVFDFFTNRKRKNIWISMVCWILLPMMLSCWIQDCENTPGHHRHSPIVWCQEIILYNVGILPVFKLTHFYVYFLLSKTMKFQCYGTQCCYTEYLGTCFVNDKKYCSIGYALQFYLTCAYEMSCRYTEYLFSWMYCTY